MKRFLILTLGVGLAVPMLASSRAALAQQEQAQTTPAPKESTPKEAAPSKPSAAPAAEGHDHDHETEGKPRAGETTADYLWRKSDDAFHAGDYPRAVSLHNAIVSYDPTDVESYSVAAWLLWSMDKPEESLAFLQRGLKANPTNPQMWDAAGQQYDLQKKFADARVAYSKAVELAGAEADQMLRRRLAHASEKSGDLSGSVTTWRGLVRDFPDEAVNKNNLGRVEALKAAKDGPVAVASLGVVTGTALFSLWTLRRSESGRA